jgi:hypothetical protein
MKRVYRRQRQLYFFAGFVAFIGIVNLLFFLILYRPARAEFFQLQDAIGRLRSETASRTLQVSQKEKIIAQLQTSNQARQELFSKNFVPMEMGFAQVYPEFDRFAQQTGVKWSRVESTREPAPTYGLYSAKMRSTVQGPYSSVVNFIRDIENSGTFYIINSVDLRTDSESSAQSGIISLDLQMETFFYQ